MNSDRAKEVLKKYMADAYEYLSSFLDTSGVQVTSLTRAMDRFIQSVPVLPEETDCKNGCAYCCHLRLGASIPEAVVLFNEINTRANAEERTFLKLNVIRTARKGDVIKEQWWRKTRTACPFLDAEKKRCRIYFLRPFSCRAYHSTDRETCRSGFEEKKEIQIPCFPLYRAAADMYSSVFIRVLAEKGLHSYQVGFVRALEILFQDETAMDKWFRGEDVFFAAKLS